MPISQGQVPLQRSTTLLARWCGHPT